MKHILSADDLSNSDLEELFQRADMYCRCGWSDSPWRFHVGKNQILGSLFFEPSTRTRWSTEAAMMRLGGEVLSMEYAKESSSNKKGESLRDTIKTCSQYVDVLVVRHPTEGAIQDAAPHSEVPVINGGDGSNEHPTQALLDLYTITRHFKDMKGLTIMFTGDLACSRTIHSLAKLLIPYEMKIIVESGNSLSINSQISHVYQEDVYAQLPKIDILYMTRHQIERDKPREPSKFVMTNALASTMKHNAIIMHPLPRNSELPEEVDNNFRSKYFEQAKNGMWVRMALLYNLLSSRP